MTTYVIRRLLQAIPIMLGITLLTYGLMLATPGGPVAALSFGPRVRAEDVQRLEAQLGVNDPFVVQYLRWLLGDDWMRWDSDGDGIADKSILIPLDADGDGEPEPPGTRKGIIRGDFGRSFFHRRPVIDVLTERLGATLELGMTSLIFGAVVGILVGVGAAVKYNSWFDHISRVLAVAINALPNFWLGLILLLIFGSNLNLLPLGNRCETTLDDTCPPVYDRLEYLILPTLVLSTGLIATYSRFTRAAMLDIVNQDYVRTARSKGLSERRIWLVHAMRNAMIPVATFLGPAITFLLGGAVITETIYSWPGVGRLIVNSVVQRDYPVVMTVTIYSGLATIIGYLLSDILYAIIDPRIRLK